MFCDGENAAAAPLPKSKRPRGFTGSERTRSESPGFAGLHFGNFQNNCGKSGDLGPAVFAVCSRRATFLSEMCDCCVESENIVRVLDDLPLALLCKELFSLASGWDSLAARIS